MNTASPPRWVPAVPIIVSVLSLLVAATTLLFNFRTQKEAQATVVDVRCRFVKDAAVRTVPLGEGFNSLEDPFFVEGSATLEIFRNPKGPHTGVGGFKFLGASGQLISTVDLTKYSKAVFVPLECLVTNQGGKAFSIERFQTAYSFHYSNDAQVSILNFLPLQGVYESDGSPGKLPFLLAPNAQADYTLIVPWPLEDEALGRFRKACPGGWDPPGHLLLRNTILCLADHNMTLADSFEWHGSRGLQVAVTEAGGKRFYMSRVFRDFDETEF